MYLKYSNDIVIEVPDNTFIFTHRYKYYFHKVIPLYPRVHLKDAQRYKYAIIPIEKANEIVRFFNIFVRPSVVRKSHSSLAIFVYSKKENPEWILKLAYRDIARVLLARFFIEEFENKYYDYIERMENIRIREIPILKSKIKKLFAEKNVEKFIEQINSRSLLVLVDNKQEFYELSLDVLQFNTILSFFYTALTGKYTSYFKVTPVIEKYAFLKIPSVALPNVFPVRVQGVVPEEDITENTIVIKDDSVVLQE